MSKNDFILCSEMISAAFGSIEKSSLEKNNKFFNSWKKIICFRNGRDHISYGRTFGKRSFGLAE